MLYIFAGFSKTGLHAGGLQHCKESVFTVGDYNEILYPVESRISSLCLRDGITWDWFPENWFFGNGVTIHKTLASPAYRTAATASP